MHTNATIIIKVCPRLQVLGGHYDAFAAASLQGALISRLYSAVLKIYSQPSSTSSGRPLRRAAETSPVSKGRKNGFSRDVHPESPSVFFILFLHLRFSFSLTLLRTRPAPLSRARATEDLAGAAWPLTPSCQRP